MRKLLAIISMFLFTAFFSQYVVAELKNPTIISNYQVIFTPGFDQQGHLKIAIRQYAENHQSYFLVVDPDTFTTQVLPASAMTLRSTAASTLDESAKSSVQNTPYIKALHQYTSAPYLLTNHGLTHATHSVNGMFLTIDMCPAKKPFEEKFFNTLVALAEKNKQAVPIAISISGLWITHHQQEFSWLIQQARTNKLQITWINHSFTHAYQPKAPLAENFMLIPGTDINYEVLETEKLLLANGQTPSVFFRFPGLVANEKLVLALRQFGLIPIGSDAWLAKGQKPNSGSIILVHGNSNEPAGIKLIMPLLNDSNVRLLPLNQSL